MKLLFLISATLGAASAARQPEEYICYTKSQGRSAAKPCNFPFVYKGVTYNECTTVDSENGEGWCGTRYNVRSGKKKNSVVPGDAADCDYQRNFGCGTDPNTGGAYCTTKDDCYSYGNLCDGRVGGNGCICKNNKCKLSSGCGTGPLNVFYPCSQCSYEDCEDEGVCVNSPNGFCEGPEDWPPLPGDCCGSGGDCHAHGEEWTVSSCTSCFCQNGQEYCTGACPDPLPPPSNCRTNKRGNCVFPFRYKGVDHYKCTYIDSEEPWCAVVPVLSVNRYGGLSDRTEWDYCFLAPGSPCEVE